MDSLDLLDGDARTVASNPSLEPEAIAVIGIGCRFPGGIASPEGYWSFLVGKRCGIREIPADRWNLNNYYDPDPEAAGRSYSKWGGFLTGDVFHFDPAFFDMAPREVISMDPQQRLLLQVAYEAVEDSGVPLRDLQKHRTGVFVGISTSDFSYSQRYRRVATDIFAGTGSAYSIAANRISHRLDLKGPSIALDTACSSALVAVDQAIRHLSMGTCDVALAGGVNMMLDPGPFIAFSSANMLSATGAIYTFDARADGFVRGEGCGLVVLKPLAKAVADGDRIYSVIRGSAVNQDGRTPTLTAPSDAAQTAMLENLVARTAIDPEDVGYVEAHGTGTPVGDPIEASAIGRVFGSPRVDRPVLVGSFKPNLGHLESASGIAGLIKIVLSTHHGVVPPNLNFERPNPNIPFDALGLAVPVEPTPYAGEHDVRLAVVNSFGFGGTNASVAVESWQGGRRSYPERSCPPALLRPLATPDAASHDPVFIPLSANGKGALALWAEELADAVDEGGPLGAVPYQALSTALRTRRDHLNERAVVLADEAARDLPLKLRTLALGADAPADEAIAPYIVTGRAKPRRLAFTFSGQGGQWWAMARRLLTEDRTYRTFVETFDEALKPYTGWSVIAEVTRDEATSRINDADVTQAAIFSNQVGLYHMWRERGLVPELLVGHSFGEVAATHIAGCIDLETCARIIYHRGRIPHGSKRRGAMATLGVTHEQLAPLLPGDGSVVVAAYNGPTAQTISGMEAPVDAVLAEVRRLYPDVTARRLTMDFGWHSPHLDDCEAMFREGLGEISWQPPALPIVSTVTGVLETRFDAEYWWQNLRQPVSYKRAIDFCLDLGIDAFLELGPHRTVTPLIHGIAQERGASVVAVSSLERQGDDRLVMARSMANLFVNGVSLDAMQDSAGHDERAGEPLALPRRPWANERLLQLPLEARQFLFDGDRHPLLGWRETAPDPAWTNEITLKSTKYLGDHRPGGDCLFPTVGYLEMMAGALREVFGPAPVELRDFKIFDALSIGAEDVVLLRTTYDPVTSRVRIFSMKRDTEEDWRLRVEAYGWQHPFTLPPAHFDPEVLKTTPAITKDDFYRLTARHGLDYGPSFQAVEAMWLLGPRHAVARIVSAEAARRVGFVAFPGLFDSVLQSGLVVDDVDAGLWIPGEPLPEEESVAGRYRLMLPIGIRKVMVAGPLPPEVICEFFTDPKDDTGIYRVYAPDGTPLLAVENLQVKTLGAVKAAAGETGTVVIEETFEPAAEKAGTSLRLGRWLLVTGDATTTAPLANALADAGAQVETVSADLFRTMRTDDAAGLVEARLAAPEGLAGILFAGTAGGELGPEGELDTERFVAAVEAASCGLVTVGQVLDRLRAAPARPALVVLGRASRRTPADGAMTTEGLADSALLGLSRTIANECPEFAVRHVDADADAFTEGTALARAALEDSDETEIVLRGRERQVPRLRQGALTGLAPRHRTIVKASEDANFTVTMTSPGLIDHVVLRESPMPTPEADEVVVEVAAVGLNFRDIMAATGILPDEAEGPGAWWRNLGLEFAGTIVRVGAEVEGFAPGDRVMGMGKGFLRRFAAAEARFLMRVPEHVELKDAATLPAAFMTAHYSLVDVGRLSDDEKVLIHLATGGVGLAAIQVARHVGAEILASAGSDAKRAFLRDLGIGHIMNSRSLEFAEAVRAATSGRGVDVVLNALSGAGIDKGLECLAPFGRFVEIGKRDLAQDKPIGLKSLYYNNTYSVIDLSTIADERPAKLAALLKAVEALVAEGTYRPLPATRFPASRAAEAMRLFSKAQHIGKVVLTFDEPEIEVEIDLSQAIRFSAEASYLVTGGLRGFGVAIADFLSRHGAGRLLLAGRNGTPDEEAAPVLAAIAARGTQIVPVALDVTDAPAVDALVAAYARSDKPLKGIVHGAAVIEDGFLNQLDAAQIARVIRPKAGGVWNLHKAATAHGAKLDFFVSFSSLAQVIGSPGQANYTAANSVLNAMGSFRKGRGLPGSAAAWGSIAGSGFVARSEALGNYLESIGMKPVQDQEAAEALGTLLRAEEENLGFARADWAAIGRALSRTAGAARVKPLLAQRTGGRSRIQAELIAAPREAWDAMLADLIRAEVAKVLKVSPSDIPADRRLSELGLDSLSSFELKNRIEAHVDVNIPVAKFLQTPTVTGLSGVVAATFEAAQKARAASAAATAGAGPSEAGSGVAIFRPLPRQEAMLALDTRPMTSSVARAALEVTASRPAPDLDFEPVARALAALARDADALRLTATAEGSIVAGEVPDLEWVAGPQALAPVTRPGHLWRFGVSRAAHGGLDLHARAHRAAADALSPHLALAAILAAARGDDTAGGAFSTFAGEHPAEGTVAHVGHLAFWKEVLRNPPAALAAPARSLAPAPTGFGLNRGPVGHLDATLLLPGFTGLAAADQEALLLSAFARALGARTGAERLVVECHDPARRHAPTGLVGPVDAAVPLLVERLDMPAERLVRWIRQRLAMGRDHGVLDTAAIEAALAPRLNAADAALRQVGFAFLDAEAAGRLAALGIDKPLDALADPFNEIRLDLATQGDALAIRLALDTAAFDEAAGRALLDAFAAALGDLGGVPAQPDGIGTDATWHAPAEALRGARPAPLPPVPEAPASHPARVSGEREVPVSLKQGLLLRACMKPETNHAYRLAWTIGRAFRISPRVDVERLRRALKLVEEGQEALRTRFVVGDDGVPRAFILPPGEPPLVVEDLPDADAAAVEARLAQLLDDELDPFTNPPYRLTILRCGAEGDVVVAHGYHTVFDGWALGVFVEQLFQAFLGLPLPPPEMGVEEYVTKFERATDPAFMAERDAYLRALYGETPPQLPDFGRNAKGLAPNLDLTHGGPAGELFAFLTPQSQQRLQSRARAAGVTETALLIAAYTQTLAAQGNRDDVMVGVPVAMRTDRRLQDFISWVAGTTLLRAPAKSAPSLETLAAHLSDQLNQSLHYMPLEYVCGDGPVHDEMVAKGSYLSLYMTGMQSPDRFARGATTSSLQRQGKAVELDLGLIKVRPLSTRLQRYVINEIDLRSFQSESGLSYRMGFDLTALTKAEARGFLDEVLDRMGIGTSGCEAIVDGDEEQTA
ncbi:SDR family NAD(P)-dependent oxidoreductase [Xanthobacter autotrophicus DSM 431]|uniref:SDR family NAD(P)-dependent oxidoreductase n=1 Tax=Xanthobacter nonsaccharivorans TaxID=3119912 RepID=UPI00372A41E5